MNLVAACLKNPVAVAVGVILITLFGVLALIRIPVQLTPDVDVPKISVGTRWSGRSPVEIEKEITYEQERFLKNVEGLVKLTSESQDGSATVTLEFRTGMDMNEALIKVENALSQVPQYPADADKPVVTTTGAQDSAIAWMVLKDTQGRQDFDIGTLHDFCVNELKPVLERVPGVARSNVLGGQERELKVLIDPEQLATKGLTWMDVRDALVRDNANVSGGDFDEGKRRYVVRVVGEFVEPHDVEDVVIAWRNDVAVHVYDVGSVRLDYKKPSFFVRNQGEAAIAMNALRDVGSNVLEVMLGLKAALKDLNDGILRERGLHLEQVYDETEYVVEAIDRVRSNILLGSLLAAIVLFLFLRSLSSTFIVCLAIPICAVGTFLVVTLLGRTINVVMLAGISFAVGMVVDNAIVVLENIHRLRTSGLSAREAALRGTTEVYGAILASTLTTLAIFLPVIFNEGEVAQLFRDIAIAISAGVGLSLIVSVTVIPTFAARIKTRTGQTTREDHGFVARLAAGIAGIVGRINARWSTRIATVVVLTSVALGLTIALVPDTEYLPTGNRNLVFGILQPPPGYNLAELRDMGTEIEAQLEPTWNRDDDGTGPPAMRNFFFVARGRSVFMGASAVRPERARDLVAVVQAPLSRIPGLFAFVTQSSLFSRGLTEGRTIDIDVTGSDLERLVEVGGRVFGMARGLFPEGAQIRPVPSLDLGSPEIRLVPNRHRMSELGLRNGDLGFLLDVFVDGAKVSDYKLEGEEIDLTLQATNGGPLRSEKIEGIPIYAGAANPVSIGDVARVVHTSGPEQINHIETDRVITIQVSPPADVPLERAMRSIREKIVVPLREELRSDGIRLELTGTADKLEATRQSMKWNFVLAVLITYLLLAALFASFLHPFVILFSVPLAWVGGVLALALVDRFVPGGQKLDVLTMLGFIILIGIVVNNAILIVHQALQTMRTSGATSVEAVRDAVQTRTRPILMSVLTSCLGMLPLVVAPGAGAELYRGLGAVVLGGLAVSTVFTLFLIPALFTILADLFRIGGRVDDAA